MTAPPLAHDDNAEIIRRLFDALKTKNRGVADELLSDDFTFTSPYDDRIDKATYFERCWPNSDRIRSHVIEKIFVEGNGAFVLYSCDTVDGATFKNVEFCTFEGGSVRSVNVYFGATYEDGTLVRA